MDKTIGALAWFFHGESSNVLTPPTDQLLHYLIPKRTVAGFLAHARITSTGTLRTSRALHVNAGARLGYSVQAGTRDGLVYRLQ
jgi:hypothetical protein